MNATINFLLTRRSVPPRLLADPGPDKDELQTILRIASRVPDHGRLIPWRFIVFDRASKKVSDLGERIAEIFKENNPEAEEIKLQGERAKMSRAPLTIAVVMSPKEHHKVPEIEQILSAGAVCMNLVTAANAMGYATSWLTEWHAFDRQVLDAMGLEPHESLAGFIYIGTPETPSAERERPDLENIVSYFDGVKQPVPV